MEDDEDVDLAAPEGQSDNEEAAPPPIPFSAAGDTPPPIPFGDSGDAPPPISFDDHPAPEGKLKSFLRGAAHSVIPGAAFVPGMMAGATAGAPLGPVGSFVGGLAGGMISSAAAGAAQEKVLQATGLDDSAQRAANEEENPISAGAGEIAGGVVAFSPGKLADSLVKRVLGGATMGALDAAQQYGTKGEVDPKQVAVSTGVGAVFTDVNRLGKTLEPAGAALGEKIVGLFKPTNARVAAGDPEATKDQSTAARSESVKTGVGNAQVQAPPSENVTGVGNNNGERSSRTYQKRIDEIMSSDQGDEPGVTKLDPGDVSPDIALAMSREEAPPPAPAAEQSSTNPVPEPPKPAEGAGTNAMMEREQPGTQQAQTQNPSPIPMEQSGAWDQPFQAGVTKTVVPELKVGVNVDSQYDVPWLAGSSNDMRTIYFDPRLPDLIDVGGRMLNPKQPIIIHELRERFHEEQIEQHPASAGKSREEKYEEAHHQATMDENESLAKRGYTPEQIKSYQEQMDALAQKTEHERPSERHPPPDLWEKIYPAKEAKDLAQEAGVRPGSDEGVIDVAKTVRERGQIVHEKMAAKQLGEAFVPEPNTVEQNKNPAASVFPVGNTEAAQSRQAKPLNTVNEANKFTQAKIATNEAMRKPRILEDLSQTDYGAPQRKVSENDTIREQSIAPKDAPAPKKKSGAYPVHDREGNVIANEKSEVAARSKTNRLRIAGETMDKFTNPPEDVAGLRKWAEDALAHAKAEGWTKYLGRADTGEGHLKSPRESIWMDELQALTRKDKKGKYTNSRGPEDFLARDKRLRAGEEDADLVRQQRIEEGDAAMRRDPKVDEVEGGGKSSRQINLSSKAGEEAAPVKRIDPNSPEGKAIAERVTGAGKKPDVDAQPRAEEGVYVNTVTKRRLEPTKSETLRERLGEEYKGGGNRQLIAREVIAQAPGVKVHTIEHAEMDTIGKDLGYPVEAIYDSEQHAIFLRPGADPETVLHEAVHAITSRRINSNPAMRKVISDFMDTINHLPEMKSFVNAFKNAKEFLAEGMSNKKFQEALEKITVDPETARKLGLPEQAKGSETNGFRAFVAAIRRILNLKPDQHNALEAVVRLTDIARSTPDRTVAQKYEFGKREPKTDAQVQSVRDQGDDLLKQAKAPWLLKLRDMDKIAQSSDKLFGGPEHNPIRRIHEALEKARIRTLELVHEDEPLMRRGLELQQEMPDEFRKLETLIQDESYYQRFGDLPINKQGFKTVGPEKAYRDSKHPDLETRWNDLPDELKDYRADLYKYTSDRNNKLNEGLASNLLTKSVGIDDPALAKKFMNGTHTEADYKRLGADDRERESRLELIQDVLGRNSIVGPYTPFKRYGGFAVTGKYKMVETGKEVASPSDNSREFKSKADAEEFAKQQHSNTKINSYYVDITSGERFTKVTEPVMRDGKPVMDAQGQPRTFEKEIALSKNDPNTEQRWKATVERGYLRMHETRRDALAHERDLHQSGDFEKTDAQEKAYQPDRDAVALAGAEHLDNMLKHNTLYENMSPSNKEATRQLLAEQRMQSLASTRQTSARLHRNYVRGADERLLMNMQNYAHETANQLARQEHGPAIDAGLEKAELMINDKTDTSNARRKVLNEISSRVDAIKTGGFSIAAGQMGPALHRLMSWSYMARLATPGFTIRNLTQPGLFSLPEIGSRHGFGATGREMLRVYRDISAGKTMWGGIKDTGKAASGKLTDPVTFVKDILGRLKDPAEKKFLENIVKSGHLDADAGFQVAEHIQRAEGVKTNLFGAEKETKLTKGIDKTMTGADKALHWMEEVSRQMPRAAETINRAVTGLTAYRMELKRNGGDRAKAEAYAKDVVDNTQFRYSDTNKPTWQRSPFARMAFQFKQFGKSTYEFLGRHIGNVISKETDPETRKASMKALGGLFVTHTIMAGVLGLPFEPVRALLIGAKTAGFTNAEWDDVENGIREHLTAFGNLAGLNEKNSKKLGEALARGMPRLLGMDLSPGLGIENMMLFGSPKSGSDRDFDTNLTSWFFQMAGGAPASLVIQALHGVRDIQNGDYAGGLEKLSILKIGSDVLKAEEGYRKGKENARGRQTMAPYSATEALTKAMGIPVAREAEQNAYAHQVYQEGQGIKDTKSKATAAWLAAKDPEAKAKAFAAAREAGVEPKALTAAATRALSERKRLVNGVATNKDTKPIATRLNKVYNTGE